MPSGSRLHRTFLRAEVLVHHRLLHVAAKPLDPALDSRLRFPTCGHSAYACPGVKKAKYATAIIIATTKMVSTYLIMPLAAF